MNVFKLFAASVLLLSFFSGCNKEDDTANEEVSNFTVMTNSSDPLLVMAKTDDGSIVEFFGERDGSGIPSKVDLIVVTKGNDTTYFYLDAQGRPKNVLTNNGIEFSFNWITNKKAALTVVSQYGEVQINTEIKMSKSPHTPVREETNGNSNYSRMGKKVFLRFTPSTPVILTEPNGPVDFNGTSSVDIVSCGFPADGTAFVIGRSISGKHLGYFPAKRVTLGKYAYSIPYDIAPLIDPKRVCNEIANVIAKACDLDVPAFTAALCPALTAAMVASGVGTIAAAPIGAACEYIALSMQAYCGLIAPTTAPDKICAAALSNRSFKEDIVLYAGVNALPKTVYSASKIVSPGSTYPSFGVDLGSATTVRTLKITPSAPAAGDDFVATADVSCLQAGSIITFSVAGSDGYANSETHPISGTQKDGLFSLSVPGANVGVTDVLTIAIKLPDGRSVSRQASVVFH